MANQLSKKICDEFSKGFYPGACTVLAFQWDFPLSKAMNRSKERVMTMVALLVCLVQTTFDQKLFCLFWSIYYIFFKSIFYSISKKIKKIIGQKVEATTNKTSRGGRDYQVTRVTG